MHVSETNGAALLGILACLGGLSGCAHVVEDWGDPERGPLISRTVLRTQTQETGSGLELDPSGEPRRVVYLKNCRKFEKKYSMMQEKRDLHAEPKIGLGVLGTVLALGAIAIPVGMELGGGSEVKSWLPLGVLGGILGGLGFGFLAALGFGNTESSFFKVPVAATVSEFETECVDEMRFAP